MLLGAHIGISGGLGRAPALGRSIGCEAIQIFSKSPQMWSGPPVPDEAAEAFRAAVRSEGLRATAVHHGYLANLASPKAPGLERSRRALRDELERAEKLGVEALIVHPGAHLGSGIEEGTRRLAESLNGAFAETPGFRVRLLLENMAGQGSTLGAEFTELARVLHALEEPARSGVALDTCHLLAAGHEFRTPTDYGRLIDRIGTDLGTESVRAFHLNDAKGPIGSHRDRHENIGRGTIGLEGFRLLVRDPRFSERPGYLETPLDGDDYAAYRRDLETLSGLRDGPAETPKPRPPKARRAGAAPRTPGR